jgi:hypothetical protein
MSSDQLGDGLDSDLASDRARVSPNGWQRYRCRRVVGCSALRLPDHSEAGLMQQCGRLCPLDELE